MLPEVLTTSICNASHSKSSMTSSASEKAHLICLSHSRNSLFCHCFCSASNNTALISDKVSLILRKSSYTPSAKEASSTTREASLLMKDSATLKRSDSAIWIKLWVGC
ncbi:putative disease resistance protein RGA3 [Trifolium repens]|nr:putative disease resistance protein RGA3 [Trifolium repens]